MIVGHERAGVSQKVYFKEGSTVQQLREAINRFRIADQGHAAQVGTQTKPSGPEGGTAALSVLNDGALGSGSTPANVF